MERRQFVKTTLGGAAFTIVPSTVLVKAGRTAPSDKLDIALIGVGGRARANLDGVKGENIVALCDVDDRRAEKTFLEYPEVPKYKDFRLMFDKEHKNIDAVVVSTPDHTHAPAVLSALSLQKHVYCEKPLAHSLAEVRKITETAREAGVATQMGNQGHSSEHIRLMCEWIWAGAIGEVREVHAWSDRPSGGFAFPVAMARPTEEPPVPEELDWDLWLGPAAWRPYHSAYVPAMWRGWIDFGTGALGDMGCHILDPSFWALKLGAPEWIEANTTHYQPEVEAETYPVASIIRFQFPARGAFPPLKLTWFDGGLLPPRPEDFEPGRQLGGNGEIIIGDKGKMIHGSHGAGGVRIFPEEKMQAFERPESSLPRSLGHHLDWINACKGGPPAGSNFDYGGPLTELALLGVLAARLKNRKLVWDSENLKFTNDEEANALVTPAYREGWNL